MMGENPPRSSFSFHFFLFSLGLASDRRWWELGGPRVRKSSKGRDLPGYISTPHHSASHPPSTPPPTPLSASCRWARDSSVHHTFLPLPCHRGWCQSQHNRKPLELRAEMNLLCVIYLNSELATTSTTFFEFMTDRSDQENRAK